jgi:hypothetical protein
MPGGAERAATILERLGGTRASIDLHVPGRVVRDELTRRAGAVRSVELIAPRTVRVGVGLGPLTRHVELRLLEEIICASDRWIPVGDLSGSVGILLRLAQLLRVKEDLMGSMEVRRGEGFSDRLFVDLPRLLAESPLADYIPEDAEMVVSEIDFTGGDVEARIYAEI